MAKAESSAASARSPRGTKPVTQAFFTALDQLPDASRAAVAKAAQSMIRDELRLRRDKMKAAAAKEREKARKPAAKSTSVSAKPVAGKAAAKASAAKPRKAAGAAKRRTRKPSDIPAAA